MSETNRSLPPAQEVRKPLRRGISPLMIALALSFAFLAYCVLASGLLTPREDAPVAKASANTYTQLIPDGSGTPVSVTLTGSGADFTLVLEGDAYRIAGEDAAINPAAAKELLSSGASILSRRTLTGPHADYGINETALRAEYTYKNGSNCTLLLGQQVPTGEGWYAAVEGDAKVYIVNNALQRALTVGKQALYALPDLSGMYSAQTLSSVTIELAGESPLTIARVTKENPFNTMVELTSPIHYPANSERAAEVYLALDEIRLTGIAALSGRDEDWGLASPVAVLTLLDRAETRLVIGDTGTDYTLRLNDEPAVYTVDPETLVFLNSLSVPWLAEQLPGLVMLNQVAEIRVTAGAESLLFTADQAAHTYTLDGQSIAEEAFLPVYQQMIGLLIERYVPQTTADRPARLTLEYTFRDGSAWTLALCEYDAGYDLIVRGDCSCFLVSRARTDALVQALLALREVAP